MLVETKNTRNDSILYSDKLNLGDLSISNYEKAIKILIKVKDILKSLEKYEDILSEIDWIVHSIKNKTMFDLNYSIKEQLANSSFPDYVDLLALMKTYSLQFNDNTEYINRAMKKDKTSKHSKTVNEKSSRVVDKSRLTTVQHLASKKKTIMKTTMTTSSAFGKIKEEEYEHKTISDESSADMNKFKSDQSVNNIEGMDNIQLDKEDIEDKIELQHQDAIMTSLKSNESTGFPSYPIGKRFSKAVDNLQPLIENIEDDGDGDFDIGEDVSSFMKPLSPVVIKKFNHVNSSNFHLFCLLDPSEPTFNIESISFDIFKTSEILDRSNVMGFVFREIVNDLMKIDKEEILDIDFIKLNNFIDAINNGYVKENPYHNELHGSDVCQTVYSWLKLTNFDILLDLELFETLAFLTASLIHDFKHPGLNNNYMANSLSEIAITYNDKSILENMHVAEAFKVLLRPECNIFENFSQVEFKIIRKRMIETVLHTDMAMHFTTINKIKGRIDFLTSTGSPGAKYASLENILTDESGNIIENKKPITSLINPTSTNQFEDQQEILNFIMHSADISHNTKHWSISQKWSDAVYTEFFAQGDKERELGLPISMFCDRFTADIPKAQIGFIVGIILPNFETFTAILPELKIIIKEIENNKSKWEEANSQQLLSKV